MHQCYLSWKKATIDFVHSRLNKWGKNTALVAGDPDRSFQCSVKFVGTVRGLYQLMTKRHAKKVVFIRDTQAASLNFVTNKTSLHFLDFFGNT